MEFNKSGTIGASKYSVSWKETRVDGAGRAGGAALRGG